MTSTCTLLAYHSLQKATFCARTAIDINKEARMKHIPLTKTDRGQLQPPAQLDTLIII